MFAAFGPDPDMQLYGRGLRRRLPTMLGGDQRRLRMAYSLMFALPGTPTLFYGEEIGMGENLADRGPARRAHADAVDRRPDRRVLHGARRRAVPPAARPSRLRAATPSTSPTSAPTRDSLLNWFERMIRLRKELPEIGWGRCTVLDGGATVALVLRHDWEGRHVVTAHNLAKRAATAGAVDVGDGPGTELRDLLQPGAPIRRQGWARPHPA